MRLGDCQTSAPAHPPVYQPAGHLQLGNRNECRAYKVGAYRYECGNSCLGPCCCSCRRISKRAKLTVEFDFELVFEVKMGQLGRGRCLQGRDKKRGKETSARTLFLLLWGRTILGERMILWECMFLLGVGRVLDGGRTLVRDQERSHVRDQS